MIGRVIRKKIKNIFPRSFRLKILKFYYLLQDFLYLLGKQDKTIPRKSEILFIGKGNFKKIGERFLKYFIEIGDLKPFYKVLDVGCGLGRMAIPLTKYLDKEGSYYGIDIVKTWVEWCKKNISLKYPNFHFQFADIYNAEYNPKGRFKASEYKFPWEDEFFDFVFLTSVFTHMLPEDLENYLSEIARVLKKGRKCFITYFLLNEESLQSIKSKKSEVDFKYDFGKFRAMDNGIIEAAISYQEQFILDLYKKYKIRVEGIYYGSWCSRKKFLNYQDIIVATKE